MTLPFSTEQFFDVFAAYNVAVWPAQWVLMALGFGALAGALSRRPVGARFAYWVLGALWVWMALAYHLARFEAINPAARTFATFFLVAGVIFVWLGSRPAAPVFRLRRSLRGFAGLTAALFGLVGYQLLNPLFGHFYPAAPGFGLPCPTTIFTLGLLSLAEPAPEKIAVVIPTLWAFVGSVAAFTLGVTQDYILLAAGLWGIALLLPGARRVQASG